MKQILTKETKDNLIEQLKMIEEVAIKDKDIQDRYFPHTIYEISSILEKAIVISQADKRYLRSRILEIMYTSHNKAVCR